MKKLSDIQIKALVKPENKKTGVKAITEEMLKSIDLDSIPKVVRETKSWCGDFAIVLDNGECYARDNFTPRAGSYVF